MFSIFSNGIDSIVFRSFDKSMFGVFGYDISKTRIFYKGGNAFGINCSVISLDKFDRVRLFLRNKGLIDDYCVGLATDEEINSVLSMMRHDLEMGSRYLIGSANSDAKPKRI